MLKWVGRYFGQCWLHVLEISWVDFDEALVWVLVSISEKECRLVLCIFLDQRAYGCCRVQSPLFGLIGFGQVVITGVVFDIE